MQFANANTTVMPCNPAAYMDATHPLNEPSSWATLVLSMYDKHNNPSLSWLFDRRQTQLTAAARRPTDQRQSKAIRQARTCFLSTILDPSYEVDELLLDRTLHCWYS